MSSRENAENALTAHDRRCYDRTFCSVGERIAGEIVMGDRVDAEAPTAGELSDAAAARDTRLALFDIGPDDARVLALLRPIFLRSIDGILETLFERLLAFPDIAAVLRADPDRLARLRAAQREYFLAATAGRFDAEYFAGRLRVGETQQWLAIRPDWYISTWSCYLRLAVRALFEGTGGGTGLLPAIDALIKSVMLDMSLAIEGYIGIGFVTRDVASHARHAADVATEVLHEHERVGRMKDDLVAMLVHDLRSPMQSINARAQIALRTAGDLLAAQREQLLRIDQTSREVARLLQDILDLSKLEAGEMSAEGVPVTLADMAKKVIAECEPLAAESRATIANAISEDLPPVEADPLLLRRLLTNLLVNALKHSGSPEVRAEASLEGHEITLRVIDFGIGIPESEQASVFEKFRTTRASHRGMGLGLYFCKLAIQRMGGRISMTSRPGFTAFAVSLPAVPARDLRGR